jgi:aspartokinase-like uncharacterized kinase
MALLAMEQLGHMLCGMQSGLVAAVNLSQIEEILERGGTPVWMSASMVLADSAIERSWEVTSDSLAVWSAENLARAGCCW